MHGFDREIDQHDRVLRDDAHEHQDADHHRRGDRRICDEQAQDRAGNRQREREQDCQWLQHADEKYREHHVDHHQAVAHAPPNPSNSSACSSASPPSLTLMPGGRFFITDSALMASARVAERGATDEIRLDAGLPLAVVASDADGAFAETYVGKCNERHPPAAWGGDAYLLEHLPVGTGVFLEQDPDRH